MREDIPPEVVPTDIRLPAGIPGVVKTVILMEKIFRK
jgi:hypothetical protein